MNTASLLGLLAAVLACVPVYLASPNQRWLRSAWPARPAWSTAIALAVAGWMGLVQDMQRLTASFVFVTTLMLVFAVLPYVGAALNLRRGR